MNAENDGEEDCSDQTSPSRESLESLRRFAKAARQAPLSVSLLPESWLPWIYLTLVLPTTLILCFLTPPFQVPDEPTHLYRAYQLSELDFVGERVGPESGSTLPTSLLTFVHRMISLRDSTSNTTTLAEVFESGEIRLEREERIFISHHNSLRYPPTAHLPQAVGIAIGRSFDLPVLGLMFCGRVANALFATLLMTLAIAIAPAGKLSLAMLGLCPMFVFMAGSLSADPGLIGSTAVFAALLMRSGRPGWTLRARFGPLVVAAIFAGTGKLVYIINTLAAIFAPAADGDTFWRRNAYGILIAAIPTGLLFLWLIAVADLIVPVGQDRGVDAGVQLRLVLGDPAHALGVMAGDLLSRAWEMLIGAVGVLGWLDTLFSEGFYVAFSILFALSLVVSGPDSQTAGWRLRVAALVCCAAIVGINQFIFYISYTPVGADFVEGLQGRLFLPLVPMLILALSNPRALPPLARSLASWAILSWLAIAQVQTIALVLRRYYLGI